jgi:glyoxylase-like metal-dependent hydrolase (beta-lactamase superfamily II)
MQQATLFRIGSFVGFLACAAIAYTQAPQPTKIETRKLADNLYVIWNDFVPGNTTVLITKEGVILVDDKFVQDGDNILAEVKKLTPLPVKYVINTHYHGDHSGSNPTMAKAGATLVSSEAARRRMIDSKMESPSNVTIGEKGHIHLGGEDVDLYYLGRAHTDGDIVAHFPKYKLLASGDIFAYGDATPELIDYAGGGSAYEWTKTLNNALKLDFDRVVPGHGEPTTKAAMAKFRDTSIQLTKRVKELVAAKKPVADVEKMLRSEFHYADVHVEASMAGLMKEVK